jgi:hypothetical protein
MSLEIVSKRMKRLIWLYILRLVGESVASLVLLPHCYIYVIVEKVVQDLQDSRESWPPQMGKINHRWESQLPIGVKQG